MRLATISTILLMAIGTIRAEFYQLFDEPGVDHTAVKVYDLQSSIPKGLQVGIFSRDDPRRCVGRGFSDDPLLMNAYQFAQLNTRFLAFRAYDGNSKLEYVLNLQQPAELANASQAGYLEVDLSVGETAPAGYSRYLFDPNNVQLPVTSMMYVAAKDPNTLKSTVIAAKQCEQQGVQEIYLPWDNPSTDLVEGADPNNALSVSFLAESGLYLAALAQGQFKKDDRTVSISSVSGPFQPNYNLLLSEIARCWLKYGCDCAGANLDGHPRVDFRDFAILSSQWKNEKN